MLRALSTHWKINDPGASGTFLITNKGYAICPVTTAGAESRALPSAEGFPVGERLLVNFKTDGGDLTITGSDQTIVMTDAGQSVEFVVVDNNGTKAWRVSADTRDASSDTSTIETYLERTLDQNLSLLEFRVHDAPMSFLSAGAGSADDLGVIIGTFGTSAPELDATVDDASGTQYGRIQYRVPDKYVAGTNLTLRVTVTESAAADTSATLDAEVYRVDAPSTDICATGAQDITGSSSTVVSFTLTGTNVVPGELLDLRLAAAIDDSGGTSPNAVYRIEEVNVQSSVSVV